MSVLSYKAPGDYRVHVQRVRAYWRGYYCLVGPVKESCTTSYQTASIVADFTSNSGPGVRRNISAGEAISHGWQSSRYGTATMTSATIPGAPAGSYVKVLMARATVRRSVGSGLRMGDNRGEHASGNRWRQHRGGCVWCYSRPCGTCSRGNRIGDMAARTRMMFTLLAIHRCGSGVCFAPITTTQWRGIHPSQVLADC